MKKKVLTVIVVLIVTQGLLFGTASGRSRIRGIVCAESTGEPLTGVTVKLYSASAQAFHKPFPVTGEEGKWKAFSLRRGVWHIDFSKPGYETKKITLKVGIRPGESIPVIKILLKKLTGPALESSLIEEIGKAVNLYNEEKFTEALAELNKILEKNSETETIEIVYKFIGNCYVGLKDEQKAVAAYEKALKKFPNDLALILSIGNAYMNLNKQDRAIGYFKRIPFEEIDNVDTLYNIGIYYYNKGDFQSAITYLKQATAIDDEFAIGFYQLGLAYVALDRLEEGVKALQRFMGLSPGSPDFQTAKAITDAFSKKPGRAESQ